MVSPQGSILAGIRSPQPDFAGALAGGMEFAQQRQMRNQQMQMNEQNMALAGRGMDMREQQMQMQQQQHDQASEQVERAKSLQKAKIIYSLMEQVEKIPEQERMAFKDSLNLNMLASVGITPEEVAQFPVDDRSVQSTKLTLGAALRDIGEVPTGVKQFRAMADAAGLKPGTEEYQNAARVDLGVSGRAPTGGYQTSNIRGADGVERPTRFDPRTGKLEIFDGEQWYAAAGSGPKSPASVLAGTGESNPLAGGQQSPAPGMFTSRTPEGQAALTAEAVPEKGMRFDGDKMVPITGSSVDRELSEAEKAKQQTYNTFQFSLNNLAQSFVNASTGPVAGRLPAVTSSQQMVEGDVDQMVPTLKNIFRESGEGVFTDKDQEALVGMVPKRTDNFDVAKRKIEQINRIVSNKMEVPLVPIEFNQSRKSGGATQPERSSGPINWSDL